VLNAKLLCTRFVTFDSGSLSWKVVVRWNSSTSARSLVTRCGKDLPMRISIHFVGFDAFLEEMQEQHVRKGQSLSKSLAGFKESKGAWNTGIGHQPASKSKSLPAQSKIRPCMLTPFSLRRCVHTPPCLVLNHVAVVHKMDFCYFWFVVVQGIIVVLVEGWCKSQVRL